MQVKLSDICVASSRCDELGAGRPPSENEARRPESIALEQLEVVEEGNLDISIRRLDAHVEDGVGVRGVVLHVSDSKSSP